MSTAESLGGSEGRAEVAVEAASVALCRKVLRVEDTVI
jgi:hypothetical protein